MSHSQRLQPFLLLSKSVKGIANAKLIQDALSAPGVHVFTELYESPNVVQASTLPEVAPYYELLGIFLYGTFRDYKENEARLPTLTTAQTNKLKHLSIITLSEKSQVLPYDALQAYLDIPHVRDLEDLIMDALYQGILIGKLDQHHAQLYVMSTIGRDLRPNQMDETMDALMAWSESTTRLLAVIQNKIGLLEASAMENRQQRDEYQIELEKVRQDVKSNKEQTKKKVDYGPSREYNMKKR
ncbi:hypothetical protein K501DRAFT_272231 [Backusella circina FSU 941]|nr:hypothetical protein K501DRAFT_272231 [Backusella circina FSU 941]